MCVRLTAKDLSRIEEVAFEASLCDDGWDYMLDELACLANAAGAGLFANAAVKPELVGASPRVLPFLKEYHENWEEKVLLRKAWPKLLTSGVIKNSDVIAQSAALRNRLYRKYFLPHKISGCAAFSVRTVVNDTAVFALCRDEKDDHFSAQEKIGLKMLGDAVSRAIAFAQRATWLRQQGLADGLSSCRTAALIVDRHRRVLCMNDAAEKLIRNYPNELRTKILGNGTALNDEFFEIIQEIVLNRPGTIVAFPRQARHQLLLSAQLLYLAAKQIFHNGEMLITFIDTKRGASVPNNAVLNYFKLSKSEIVLVSSLARTLNLRITSVDLQISYETARIQLKSVFSKTNTHSQVELMLLLNRMATMY